jgi:protein TonB
LGQAAVRPVRETVTRRALAWALALLANGALIALILLVPRTPSAPAGLMAIDLVLVSPPEPETAPVEPPVEAAPEPLPESLPESPPERDEAARTQIADDTDDQAIISSNATIDESMIEEGLAGVITDGLPDYGITALTETAALTGTPFVIREIFCMTSSEATREAGHCPDDPDPDGLSMLRYASEANIAAGLRAAIGHGMSLEEIRASFEGDGLPLNDLGGQPTLADGSQRPTSSADQMRDSLPPQHPDPAFGD